MLRGKLGEDFADGDGLHVEDVFLPPGVGPDGHVEGGVERVLAVDGLAVADGAEALAGPTVEDFDLIAMLDGQKAEGVEMECGGEGCARG